jgi:predicted transcriptional regulator
MPGKGGNTRDKIDRHMLHEFLWEKRDRNGKFPHSQTDLAEALGITIWALSDIFKELKEQGRVEKVHGKYKINDPATFVWVDEGSQAPGLFG